MQVSVCSGGSGVGKLWSSHRRPDGGTHGRPSGLPGMGATGSCGPAAAVVDVAQQRAPVCGSAFACTARMPGCAHGCVPDIFLSRSLLRPLPPLAPPRPRPQFCLHVAQVQHTYPFSPRMKCLTALPTCTSNPFPNCLRSLTQQPHVYIVARWKC